MARADDQLTRLARLSPADLRTEWQAVFQEQAPDLSPSLLRRALAYHAQERAHGGLPAVTRRVIETLARNPTAAAPEPQIRLKPGTRLLREWNGTKHAVLVTADGFQFNDRSYASLSHIAREITGAHWSGPRFFGLKRPVHPPRQGAPADG